MKSTTTILLLLAAAALAAYVFYFEKDRPGTLELSSDPPLLFDSAEANLITITRSGETLALQKREDRWFIARPVEDRADQKACAGILENLSTLSIREVIDSAEFDSGDVSLADLGLTDERGVALSIFGTAGALGSVFIGDNGAVENTSYVMFPENPNFPHVYVVEANLNALGTPTITTLRDPKVLPFEPAEIGRLLLHNGDAEVEVYRDMQTGLWRLGKPLQSRANQEVVDKLVASVCALEVTGFEENSEEIAATITGQQSLSAWIIDPATGIVPEAGSDPAIVLEIAEALSETPGPGDEPLPDNEDPKPVVAKVSDREPVLQVPEAFLQILASNPNTLRDPHLAQIPEDHIRGVIIQSAQNPDVVLTQNGRRWISLRNGEWEATNQEAVDALIRGLNKEKIIDYVADTSANLEDFNLATPAVRIGLTTSRTVMAPGTTAPLPDPGPDPTRKTAEAVPDAELEDPEALNYLLGLGRVAATGENDEERLYATFADEPFVVSIDPAFLGLAPLHPLDWKNLGVLSFNIISLREIRIARAGEPVPTRLVYDYLVNGWKLARGESDLTDQFDTQRAHALAGLLGSFAARGWLSSRESAYRALEKPALTIELVLAFLSEDGSSEVEETVTLTFAPVAKTESGSSRLHYGRRDDSPDVFLVEDKTIRALLAPLTK